MGKLLTKSKYLIGLQCSKWLWIALNDKKRIPEPDKFAKQRFEVGDVIGELAKKFYPDGIDLSNLEFKENLERTKDALEKRKPIFEAGIMVDNLFSRADVLVPVGDDEWDVIEVKSSTSVKDINIQDVSFQKYTYEKSGLKIRKCFLMHINNTYIKSGPIEPSEFFVQAEITEEVSSASNGIVERVEKMFEVISGEEPEFNVEDILTIEYDNLCSDEFKDNLPEDSVFEVYRMLKKKKIELYKSGCVKMKDIPESVKLNNKQKIQKKLAIEGGKHVDSEKIKGFLEDLQYPIYYLDFETFSPAIPKFDGMKPYQRVPFQFSLHIQEKPNGELKHISFLAEGLDDPRPKFLQSLKDNLGDSGDILVYNQGFEKGVLNEGQTTFSEFESWYSENILPRIKDLLDVFRNFWYYDSKQKGSASIKAVLPVLSDLKYEGLEISEGVGASLEYEKATFGNVSEEEKKKVREALEKYCELDTLAEVKIVEGLGKVVKG
tara:strand:+ start:81 stop:1553 length:1473 start_codon:yes stop_codon:yes gene_type:complete